MSGGYYQKRGKRIQKKTYERYQDPSEKRFSIRKIILKCGKIKIN